MVFCDLLSKFGPNAIEFENSFDLNFETQSSNFVTFDGIIIKIFASTLALKILQNCALKV